MSSAIVTAADTTTATSPPTSWDDTFKVLKFMGISFETTIIERYRRQENRVDAAFIVMHLVGVSDRHAVDITESLWDSKVSPATISELNKKAYVYIEDRLHSLPK